MTVSSYEVGRKKFFCMTLADVHFDEPVSLKVARFNAKDFMQFGY
jgi:hypothetical protein